MSTIIEILRLTRIHSASASGFITLLVGLFYTRDIITLLGLYIIGALIHLVIFTMNECVDLGVDELNDEIKGKPLIKGSISLRLGKIIWVGLLTITIIFYFVYFMILDMFTNMNLNLIVGLLPFTISIVIFMLYNLYGKRLIGKDLLISSGVFFLALIGPGLLITSVDQIYPALFLALYFMFEFTITTDLGDIKDVEVESSLNYKTPPVVFGVRVKNGKVTYPISFKRYVYSLRTLMVILLIILFINQNLKIEPISLVFVVILTIITIGSIITITKIFSDNVFNRRKLLVRIGINEIMTFSAVPLSILSLLNLETSTRIIILVIVIFAPLIWLKFFLKILYKDIVPIT